MTPIDRRVRLWAWMVARQGSVGTKSDAEIIAMQSRHTPNKAFANLVFGTVVPGTEALAEMCTEQAAALGATENR